MLLRSISILCVALLFASCNDGKKQSSEQPIILGDSSTIVTETDPKRLSNFVEDIQVKHEAADSTRIQQEQTATPPQNTDTPKTAPAAQVQKDGLKIAFKEVTIFIPAITAKTYRNQNLERANGASYQLTSGKLNGNHIQMSDAIITRVSQRYITDVIVKNELGTLHLDALTNITEWTPLRVHNNITAITGLDESRLDYEKATPAQIKAAVTRAAKNKRMSRRDIQKWENSVRRIRSVNQKPLLIILRSVMWKIDGKDANGKNFSKQVRIDMPV